MSTTLPETARQNVRAEAAAAGLSMTKLAAAAGLSRDQMSRRNTGETPWGLDDLVAVGNVLGIDPHALVRPRT